MKIFAEMFCTRNKRIYGVYLCLFRAQSRSQKDQKASKSFSAEVFYSAKYVSDAKTTWAFNGADNWNGGGLHMSHDYGAGEVDATAAVRLAETWTKFLAA